MLSTEREFVTPIVQNILLGSGVDIPRRKMTYGELRNWIDTRVRSGDLKIIGIIGNQKTMYKMRREMRLDDAFRDFFGRHAGTASKVLGKKLSFNERLYQWDQPDSPNLTPKTAYQKSLVKISRGDREEMGRVMTKEGMREIRKGVLREGGTRDDANKALSFLRKEALRKSSVFDRGNWFSGSSVEFGEGGFIKSPSIKYSVGSSGPPRMRAKNWWDGFESWVTKTLRSGNTAGRDWDRAFGFASTPMSMPQVRARFLRENRVSEFNSMMARIERVLDTRLTRMGDDQGRDVILTAARGNDTARREMEKLTRIGGKRNLHWFTSRAVQRKGEKILNKWSMKNPGANPLDYEIPSWFGKAAYFRSKGIRTLRDLVNSRKTEYYFNFLAEWQDTVGKKSGKELKEFKFAINAAAEIPFVREMLREYNEMGDSSSPDLYPYREQFKKVPNARKRSGYRWEYVYDPESRLTWRSSRRDGFGVSDNWRKEHFFERQRVKRGFFTDEGWVEKYVWEDVSVANWAVRKKDWRSGMKGEFDPLSYIAQEDYIYGGLGSRTRKYGKDYVERGLYAGTHKGTVLERLSEAVRGRVWADFYRRLTLFTEHEKAFFSEKVDFSGIPKHSERWERLMNKYIPGKHAKLERAGSIMEEFGGGKYAWLGNASGIDLDIRGEFDPNLTIAGLKKTKSREQAMNWHQDFTEKYGWDVARFAGSLYGKDVSAIFMKQWNALPGMRE